MNDRLLAVAAAGEAATGLLLLAAPATVVPWLLGAELAGAGIVMCRIAGSALIALGIACWPGARRASKRAYGAMLIYSSLATLLLAFVGFGGAPRGRLLWAAVVLHALLTAALGRAWIGLRSGTSRLG